MRVVTRISVLAAALVAGGCHAAVDGEGTDAGALGAGSSDGGSGSGDGGGSGGGSGTPVGPCSGALAGASVSPATLQLGSTTIGTGTSNSLLTVMNTGTSALALANIGIAGDDPGDFASQTDCPASLAAGDKCYVRVAFSPTATGTRNATASINGQCASAVTGTGVALAAAFYVAPAPTGSDSGDGSVDHPFATLAKAQAAMRASGGSKLTTYLRKGTYTAAAIGKVLQLSSADNGETWSYYPPDGVDSAILDGGSTAAGTGLVSLIDTSGASKITIDGLTLRNFDYAGVSAFNSTNITVKDCIIYGGFQVAQYGAQGVTCGGVCTSWSVLNNVMHDVTGGGANVVSATSGDVSNLIYAGNFVYDTCTMQLTPPQGDGGDCGALYTQDNTAKSKNITITNNFVRDGNPYKNGSTGSGIYLDDCLSNATVSGNILTGLNGSNTTFLHAGDNDTYIGNIIDLGGYGQHISVWQTSANNGPLCNIMTNNKYTGNIILAKTAIAGFSDLSYPHTVTPKVDGNLYYSYGAGKITNNPESSMVNKDPMLTGCYDLDPASPAYGAAFGFSPLLKGWGPPGFVIPKGASSAPSYASPSCDNN